MVNLLGKFRNGARTNADKAVLALDLTTEAIILHERTDLGGWKKFASVRLDDSEFPIVIGLLRSEAESITGTPTPVRLWLPGEQVLKLRTQIMGNSPKARLRAGFGYIDKETTYRPEDVAIAVSPTCRDGKTTMLVTFAETWHEAMDSAARWGFIPGDLSTRHHSSDFGAGGPVFHLNTPPPKPPVRKKRHRVAVTALILVAAVGGAAVWSLGPWGGESGPPNPLPGTEMVEATDMAPTAAPPNSEPLSALEPTLQVSATPPRHFPNSPAPNAPAATDQLPNKISALSAPNFSAPTIAIAAPTEIAAAPLPPLEHEPAPPEHDTVTYWTPLTILEQPGPFTLQAMKVSVGAVGSRPAWRKVVSLIASTASSPLPPQPVPIVESPPAEPIEAAIETIKPNELATDVEAELQVEPIDYVPEPEPIRPVGVLTPNGVVVEIKPREIIASVEPVGPLDQRQPTEEQPAEANSPPRPGTFPIPIPRPRGAGSNGTGEGVVDRQPGAKLIIPMPRLSKTSAPEIPSNATVADEDTTATSPEPETPTETSQEDTNEPTRFASATSPLPSSRPAIAARPRELLAPVLIPALTGTAKSSIRSAATENGIPMNVTMLVGIHNLESGRKALLRLPDGSYRFVTVGDVLDGWRVSLIGLDAMRITRSGEDRTLLLLNR